VPEGTWTPAPPTAQLTVSGYTGSIMSFEVGDTFVLVITGPPNQPVTVAQNFGSPGFVGYTNSQGVYSNSATWGASDPGSYNQTWYVGGVSAAPSLSFVVLPNPGPSIPNSFNAGPNPVTYSDITGTWEDTIPGPAEWALTQNGPNVAGTMTRTPIPECGISTYRVSGTFSNGAFTLTANLQSNQYPCDPNLNHVDTSIQETVTLTGPSASQAAAQWTSASTGGPGSGNSSWQAKTQHYNISYASYISVDHIKGPSPCGIVPTRYLLYKGDAYRNTYRTTQSIIAIPDAGWSDNFYANTGPTRNYSVGSPSGSGGNLDSFPLTSDIYGGPYGGLDEDGVAGDCRLWNAAGQASTTNMQQYSVSYPSVVRQTD
jgi:hypothetical protein